MLSSASNFNCLNLYIVHFSLLHSSTAQSSFNQNLSGRGLIRHVLQNLFLWTLCQKRPNLPTLPTGTQWILLADPPEVHIILDPQISHGKDIDEYKLAPYSFSLFAYYVFNVVYFCFCS